MPLYDIIQIRKQLSNVENSLRYRVANRSGARTDENSNNVPYKYIPNRNKIPLDVYEDNGLLALKTELLSATHFNYTTAWLAKLKNKINKYKDAIIAGLCKSELTMVFIRGMKNTANGKVCDNDSIDMNAFLSSVPWEFPIITETITTTHHSKENYSVVF